MLKVKINCGAISIWSSKTGEELFKIKPFSAPETSPHTIKFSPNGKRIIQFANIADDGMKTPQKSFFDSRTPQKQKSMATIWSAETGQKITTLMTHGYVININDTVVFSPDGHRVVTTSLSGTIKVWDAETGRELLTLTGYDSHFTSASYSPDGKRILTTSDDKTTKVWDANTGQELLTLTGYDSHFTSASYSPDGNQIITNGKVKKVWDAETGKELFTIKDDGHRPTFSSNGQRILTIGGNKARIYTTDIKELQKIANSRTTRQLTAEEKEKYGVPDYQ